MKQAQARRPGPAERPAPAEAEVTPLRAAHAGVTALHRLCAAVALASLVVLALDTTGLREWASRMPFGPVRDGLLAVIAPMDATASSLGLDIPRRVAHDGFALALGAERDAGWGAARPAAPASAVAPAPKPKRMAPRVYTSEEPLRVLLVGDSLMGWGFGTELEASLRDDPATEVTRKCTVSSGLSRPDFYSWPAQVRALTAETDYDIVVGVMGGNDIQGLYHDRRVYSYGEEGWSEGYRELSREFIGLLAEVSRKAYWVALPPMRRPAFHAETREVNAIHRSLCKQYPDVEYVVPDRLIGDANGVYSLHKTIEGRRVQMRSGDGIHLSIAGGRQLADEMLRRFFRDFAVERHESEYRPSTLEQSERDAETAGYVPRVLARAQLASRPEPNAAVPWYMPSVAARASLGPCMEGAE